jgi:hypothetical protein
MAPEILNKEKDYDCKKADIYALGILLEYLVSFGLYKNTKREEKEYLEEIIKNMTKSDPKERKDLIEDNELDEYSFKSKTKSKTKKSKSKTKKSKSKTKKSKSKTKKSKSKTKKSKTKSKLK